jgi:glucokinase
MSINTEQHIQTDVKDSNQNETRKSQNVQGVFLGIDIGGTDTKIGLINKEGKNLVMARFATQANRAFPEFIENLKDKINQDLLAHHPDARLKGIGIGAPNANYWTGKIEDASNLSWETVDVVSALKKEYDLPVVITNDANAAAMGEKYFGAAQEMENFIVLTLGTGLGSGIMINRSIVYGAGGHAGEIGHMVVDPDGRQCGCGRRGCLETYVSASGIKRTVFELISEYTEPSRLRDISFNDLTAEEISDAAADNDPIALKAFERTGRILGMKLADVVALINPEAIILAGGLAKAGNLILEPVQRHLEKNLLRIFRGKTKVLLSQLVEGNLAILGAGALIMQHVKKETASLLSDISQMHDTGRT